MPAAAGTPQLTISALLDQPSLLSRDLVNLVYKRLIADRLFVRGTPEQVRGGVMRYQELESIFVDDDPESLSEGADFPLTDWSETLKTAPVKAYGFGTRVTNYMIRRHQIDMVVRGERKLANRLIKYIDTQAMTALTDTTTYTAIQTSAASAHWNIAGTDILGDITAAQYLLEAKDNGYAGYEGATLIVNTIHRNSILNNTGVRAVLPREGFQGPNLIQSGYVGNQEMMLRIESGFAAPFLGLKEILFTPQLATTKAILMDTSIAGTIADEQPDGTEGFVGYDPGPGFAPIYVKVEKNGRPAVHTDVYAGRWPAIALVQPDAVVNITGVN